ncbi:MAG: DUF2953 domain-containing protein [Tissierellia bacterium]|nr:DUF2953 domain-containing protein [Tissierellia bacterium]
MIILAIFLLIVLILLILPIKIKFYYEFTDSSKYKITITYLFGLIKKEIDSTKKEKKENKRSLSNNKEIDSYELLRYFIDKGTIEKIYLMVNIGLKDPFLLGIIVGLIWSIISIFLGFILRDKTINEVKEKEIMVHPCFNQDIFQIFFLCIIKSKLVYIIIVYIRILKRRKGGDIFARTSHRRLNENYNG